MCPPLAFAYNTVRALCRRPRGGRLSGTCSLKAAERQSGPREYSQLRPPHFRLGSILQLLGGSKCKIRPWVESSGFEGGRKSSEIAFRMAIEMKTAVLEGMSGLHVCIQHCARALPKALGRKSKKNRPPEHCRKAVRQQRFTFTAPQRALSNCEVGEGGLGKSRSFPIKDF